MARCEVALYPAGDDESEPDRVLFLGPDRNGIPLEILALELAEGDLLVIHAMKLRRKYREHYLQVMRWSDR